VHQFVWEPHRLLEFHLLLHPEVCFPKLSSPQSVNAFFHDDGCKQDGLWNKLLRSLKNLLLLLQVEIHWPKSVKNLREESDQLTCSILLNLNPKKSWSWSLFGSSNRSGESEEKYWRHNCSISY
jgi:hypothetical protein